MAATEVSTVDVWSRSDVEHLISTAREHEPQFAPQLVILFNTGLRRGELLGLKWDDVDFESMRISIRRSLLDKGHVSTPKSGKSRHVAMSPVVADEFFSLLAFRRQQRIDNGWAEIPEWIFSSRAGTQLSPRNHQRVWDRVRIRAQDEHGVRPLKLHCTRHTFATMALDAGKSVKWVAQVLGHSDPALTLRVYAHVVKGDESDMNFADLGGARRRYTARPEIDGVGESPNPLISMARREGFEPPTLRFEACGPPRSRRCSANAEGRLRCAR
ncbi:MAG: site-specific integrase [bacterium]|nr:site-specific integrase [bacterium]